MTETWEQSTALMLVQYGFNGRDYIYFTDTFKERSYYITRSGDYWSDVTPIMPIDVMDDMAKFVFGGVSKINDEVYICGQYTRSNCNFDFLVYLRGPEDFSMGRDILISPDRWKGISAVLIWKNLATILFMRVLIIVLCGA